MKSKYLILLGDGMADWPIPALANRTPLDAAQVPALDFLAQHGQCGQVATVPPGFTPGSDVANLSILGYDPAQYYTGRGPIEAVSLGIDIPISQLAFRCNLVTIENGVMQDFTAGHISSQEAAQLLTELNQAYSQAGIKFFNGVSYRHIALYDQKFKNLTYTPPHDITDKPIADYLPKGDNAAEIIALMQSARAVLQKSEINQKRIAAGKKPATDIWLWSPGPKPQLPTFQSKYNLTGAIITAVDLLKGIGQLIGFATPNIPGATGFIDTNYQAKLDTALKLLEEVDLVYLHIEAPDEAGHMGDFALKIRAIEDFSRNIVQPCLEYQKQHPNTKIMVLPDHPTPCQIKTHALEPVPFMLYYPGITPKPATRFTESATAATGFKFTNAQDLLKYFLN